MSRTFDAITVVYETHDIKIGSVFGKEGGNGTKTRGGSRTEWVSKDRSWFVRAECRRSCDVVK
jgi:hypothetical protein